MLDTVRKIYVNLRPQPDEDSNITRIGHREFVGGMWDEIGQLQFDFLVSRGLKPQHVLLDIACGSLRAGRLFIPYLEAGNYLGIDKHADLIEAGKANEIDAEVLKVSRPEFVVSDCFQFDAFSMRPDFCIAQSLFTHLRARDIQMCLAKLSAFARPGCRFFATFFETSVRIPQLAASHSNRGFYYTRQQMELFGRMAGWKPHYLGKWNHPRGQRMVEYVL